LRDNKKLLSRSKIYCWDRSDYFSCGATRLDAFAPA
jgi:hypothetical protein